MYFLLQNIPFIQLYMVSVFLQADNIAASEEVFNHFERKVFFEK